MRSACAVIVGSHDPAFTCTLEFGTQPSAPSGDNWVSVPYHTTAVMMQDVCDDMGPEADTVAFFDPTSFGSLNSYLCGNTLSNFPYELGKAIKVQLKTADAPWIPSHF